MRHALLVLMLFSISNAAEAAKQRYCQIKADIVPVTIGRTLSKENTLFYLEKGDFYYCDPDEKATPIQEQPLNGVYSYDRPGAIYAHTSVAPGSKSHFFNSPQEAFLEGDPGQVTSVFSKPGKTWKDNKDGSLGRAWPKVASKKDRIFVLGVDYRWVTDEYGDRKLVKSAKVAVVRNDPKALKEFHAGEYSEKDNEIKRKQTGIRIGWIDQKYLRSHEFSTQYQVEETKDCTACKPLESENIEDQAKKIKKPIQELADATKANVINHINKNKCFGSRKDSNLHSEITKLEGITEGMKKFLRRHPIPSDAKFGSIGSDKLTTMRLLAYTMWGEMRSCPSRYQKAVARIALNRAKDLQKYGRVDKVLTCSPPAGKGPKKSYFPKQSLSTNLACILGKDEQFTMWGGLDPNYKRIKCIKSDEKEWDRALSMAYDIVMAPEKFEAETNELKGILFYSSSTEIKGLDEITKRFSLPDGPLDSKKCTRFWQDNS